MSRILNSRLTIASQRAQLGTVVVAGAALAVGLAVLTRAPGRLALGGMIVLVLLAAALFVGVLGLRTGLVGLLITTCMLHRFTFKLGAVEIRPE